MTAIAILLGLSLVTLGAVFWSVVVKVNTGADFVCQCGGHVWIPAFIEPGRAVVCKACHARRIL